MKNFKKTLLSCYLGYVTQSIVINLAPLFFVIFNDTFDFSYTFLANLVLVTFLIQIAVDTLSVKYVSRLGYRKTAILSQFFSAFGLTLMCVLPLVLDNLRAAVMLSVITYSIGGGLIEVVVSPIVDALPSEAKESSMSLLHSFYSWGQVFVIIVSTVLLKLFGEAYWFIIPLVWSLIPYVNIVNFSRVPIVEPATEEIRFSPKELISSKVFLLAVFMMICSGAAEQVMAQWASMFCEMGLGVSKMVGDIFGPCLFAAFMGVGRTFYGIFGDRIDLRRSLMLCSLFTVLCYLAAVFFASPILNLAGCALCGIGVSLMWPGMLALTASKYKSGAALFALLAIGGDIGCSVGPYLTGIVSDLVSASEKGIAYADSIGVTSEQLGLKAGILSGIIFPVLLFIGTLLIKNKQEKKQ